VIGVLVRRGLDFLLAGEGSDWEGLDLQEMWRV